MLKDREMNLAIIEKMKMMKGKIDRSNRYKPEIMLLELDKVEGNLRYGAVPVFNTVMTGHMVDKAMNQHLEVYSHHIQRNFSKLFCGLHDLQIHLQNGRRKQASNLLKKMIETNLYMGLTQAFIRRTERSVGSGGRAEFRKMKSISLELTTIK